MRKGSNSLRICLEHQYGAVLLFWNTNMAAVTSCENTLYYCVSVWTLALA